jgi:alanyl-tRNA synthetase
MPALPDKELKKWFFNECRKDPERHYPTRTLTELGYRRGTCTRCGTNFWSTDPGRTVCGNANCCGGFSFIGKSPAKNRLTYTETWEEYAEVFQKLGYTPVKRYPVVSRWHPTTDFTIASIAAFQPYVVTGEVLPPANPLVIPQFCLRFGDIDNVGITGAHYTGFVMLGQHAFVPPQQYDPNTYLRHIHAWLRDGIGLTDDELTFHEDAWAGNGNFGPSMEFYSRGLELGNQVYMQYEQDPSGARHELRIKVLDMGAGHERVPWFTHGKSTSYETTFPLVMRKLRKATGVRVDEATWTKFLPHAAYLNVDEAEDMEKAWQSVAKAVGMPVDDLRPRILPVSALYAIAEHTRSLLFALNDGALPSNVGGMYNLRVILRRALALMEQHGWSISLPEVAAWHAKELKPLFPELGENLDEVSEILEVEREKHLASRQQAGKLILKALERGVTPHLLAELYDSHGIDPRLVAEEARRLGKTVKVPDNFYAVVSERHGQQAAETATEKADHIDFGRPLPDTKALYYDDYRRTAGKGKVLAIKDLHVVLDETVFYPTSGGQLTDHGTMAGEKVVEVFKQGGLIVHRLAQPPHFKPGDTVDCQVDAERRIQLAQHHTTTHIINAAARNILGRHVNQASAKKDVDHAYIDITHYKPLTPEDLQKIEDEANRIVKASIKTNLRFYPRTDAEQKFGMAIYQGGAVPGRQLRIVEIPGVDIEACGGTHLNNTAEAGHIRLVKDAKVKDGVIRITFVSGAAAKAMAEREHALLNELAMILGVDQRQVPARAQELFEKWKKARKAATKGIRAGPKEFLLLPAEKVQVTHAPPDKLIERTAAALTTQPEHVAKTLRRFLEELEEYRKKVPQ